MVKEFSPERKIAKVMLVKVDRTTQQRDVTDVDPTETGTGRRITKEAMSRAHFGRIKVHQVVFGFFKLDQKRRILDAVAMDNPPVDVFSRAMWIDVPKFALGILTDRRLNRAAGIHVAEHVAVHADPQGHADDEPCADGHRADRGGRAPGRPGIRAPQPRDRSGSRDGETEDHIRIGRDSGEALEQLTPAPEPLPRRRKRGHGVRGGAVSGDDRRDCRRYCHEGQQPNRSRSGDDDRDRQHQPDANVDPARECQQDAGGDARGHARNISREGAFTHQGIH